MKETHFSNADDCNEFTVAFLRHAHFANSIGVIGHIGPDDDAISSVLAMYRLLSDLNPEKSVRMLFTGERLEHFESFENYDKVEYVKDVANVTKNLDMIVFVDGSEFHRFSKRPESLEKFEGVKICIDHHSSPPAEFDLSLIDKTRPANAEVIYRAFGAYYTMDAPLAETFLLGILGDTGNLSYLGTDQLETFDIAKELLEVAAVEIQDFQSRYRTISLRVLELIQVFIKNTKYHEVEGWPGAQSSFVDQKTIDAGEYTDNEVSEAKHIYMSQYLRVINGYGWGFVASPKNDGSVRVSFRSLPSSVNVREIVEKMGIGGGHDRAAGAGFDPEDGNPVSGRDAIKKILKWLSKNAPETED